MAWLKILAISVNSMTAQWYILWSKIIRTVAFTTASCCEGELFMYIWQLLLISSIWLNSKSTAETTNKELNIYIF